uniref:Uncharacterized protein n=1 Tax=Rhizophora mucronata TaxID=61149 RepID=A0A2P2NPP3_RHIMU
MRPSKITSPFSFPSFH